MNVISPVVIMTPVCLTLMLPQILKKKKSLYPYENFQPLIPLNDY